VAGNALSRCVGDPERFLEEHWERAVHLHQGADGADLLDLDDVDGLIAGAALRAPAFRLVKAGTPVPPAQYLRTARVGSRTITDLIEPGRVQSLFADGATVVLQGLHRYWPPLNRFCRDLELLLSHPVQANAYLTPPVASGLRVHSDTHDVFALQTHGTKHWVAYPMGTDVTDLPAPSLDTDLRPGDCLYVPRGVPHAARTVDTASLHVTLGVRVTTWGDALRRAVDRAFEDPSLGEALPPGHADDPTILHDELGRRLRGLGERIARTAPPPIADAVADTFARSRQPALTGQLRELLAVDDIGEDTTLLRRPGTTARVRPTDGAIRLVLGDRTLTMPVTAERAVRWIIDQERFRVADLAGFLDEPGRRVLARRLVREGLLVRRA
jgi:bifunctional lysine-specific demethylase and histidyl-hydroxylase NO66